MLTWILVICTIILTLVTAEVQIWGFTLNRHACWIKNHPKLERRCINYKSLYYSSVFTSLLSALTILSWIFLLMIGCTCPTSLYATIFLFTIALGSKITLIAYLSLIAKLCRLHKCYYPPVTVYFCNKIKEWMK